MRTFHPTAQFTLAISRLSTAALLLLASATSAWAGLRWEHTEQAAELSPAEESVRAEFTFTNAGSRPVSIISVTASCGCTKPVFPAEAIAPGAQGSISVGYTRNGTQQTSRITVTTDESGREPYVLTWRITAHEWVEITPRLLLWTPAEGARTKSFQVKLHPDSKAKLLDVTGADDSLQVTLRRPTAGTDEPILVDVQPSPPSATTRVQALRSTLRLRFQRGDEIVERVVYVRVQ